MLNQENEKNVPIYKIELVGNPNSCIIRINNQKYCALLDSGAEVSLVHSRIYNCLRDKPKLKKQSALLQSVKGDSIDVDGCALLKYAIGKEKQEHEFFIVQQMNRNIILGRDWLKQFGVHMYYDLGCIRVGKSYIKLEEDLHISSIVRLATKTQIKPQTAKFCMCKVKGNKQALHNRLHQVIPSENSILNQEPGLLAFNSIVKTTKQGKFFVLVINSTNKHITLREGSKIGMIEPVREFDFVNVRDNLAPKTGLSPKVSSFTEIKQKIDTQSTFKETVEEIVRHNLDLFAEKDTDLGKTQTIKMTIDTGDHPL